MENNKKLKMKHNMFFEFWIQFRRNKLALTGVAVILFFIIIAILSGFLYDYDFITKNNISNAFLPPMSKAMIEDNNFNTYEHLYIFGADNFGRDILGRIVIGARVSIIIGFITVAFAIIIGGSLGAIAGYYGGIIEIIIMRIADILLAIPNILFALAIVAALGPSFKNLLLAIGITSIPTYIRIVRASVITVKDQEFVESARAIGANDFRIILFHIIPNCLAPIIVQSTLGIAQSILSAASLSFLGLGIQPPMPEWGNMLSEARPYLIKAPHTLIFPGLAIMMAILAFNLAGDGIRDALDPKLRK